MRVLPEGRRAMIFIIILTAMLLLVLFAALYLTSMPGRSHRGEPTPLSPRENETSASLRRHVEHLALSIGTRNMEAAGSLELAAAHIARSLRESGYEPVMLPYKAGGIEVNNVEATLRGTSPDEHEGIVVIGSHYDTVPGTRGANDNASGVAAVLELARMMRNSPQERTIKFALFVNEEPPWFKTALMGSHVYASSLMEQGTVVSAMLSLETIGYYTDEPGSQLYPFPLDLVYPDRGDFIAFVGNVDSRGLVRRSVRAFRETVDFPSEGAAVPDFLPGVDWSDHWGFWQNGYPAIMVTDTAPYRYIHYHTHSDTPDKLDYERMARVVMGLEGTVRRLASQ